MNMIWDQPVHRFFEAQAAQSPEAEAVFFQGRRLTYGELNRRANQLAHYLVSLGIGPEKRVGLCVEPSLETVVGVLGILKAGGACVPLDLTHPQARLDLTLHQSGIHLLLTQEQHSPRLAQLQVTLCLDSDGGQIAQHSAENLDVQVTLESLAHMVFSAGRGILVEQRGILNRLEWMQDELDLSSADTFLHRTSPALDASLWEILLPLALGGRVVIAPLQERDDPMALRRLIAEQGVSVMHVLPSELTAFEEDLHPLRWMICGGEPLPHEIAEAFMRRSGCGLYHVYGPPEAATDVTGQLVQPGGVHHVLPVGRPVSALAVYILDKNQQLVPVGVTGEVCIAGEGLARGYVNDPDETRRRFVPNPFAETTGERMFKTGDLGRWTSEGTLELLGRTDRQVWWRGWRVELSEVELALRQEPSVDDCAVLIKEMAAGERALVACVVPTGPLASDRLRAHAEAALPAPLLPQAYVGVTPLPLTPAGEIDESILKGLPVLDAELALQVEAQLLALPEIEQAAVVVKPREERPTLVHLADLFPDWKAGAAAIESDEVMVERPAESHEQTGERELSVSAGGPLQMEEGAPATLSEALQRAATQSSDKGIIYIQPDGSEVRQSYAELLQDAERILAGLRVRGLKPQDKVLFQLERNQDFIPAFWACILGGFVPVPVSIAPTYDQVNSAVNKLHNAWEMLEHPIVLAGSVLAPAVHSLSTLFNIDGFQVQVIDELRANEPDHNWHPAQPDDLAILLLTSGSTGLPKAVMQKHRSILSRTVGTMRLNGHSSRDTSFNWMPIDHVGGIVMFHVRDVYLCAQQVHAPTHLILRDPLKWLDYIEHYQATITWAPNFAYGLVNERADEIAQRQWDLSSMRFILNAGEAIVAKTARRFMELLQPHGLRPSAMYPCWGMSETCSGVVYSHRFSLTTTSDSDQFVQVGAPVPGFSVRLVDTQDQPVQEGVRGRLQVRGPEVTCGYYQNPELNREVFTDDGWFKTGDLGVMRDGYLAIAGREKDIIIIRGINYYAHEIESVVEEVKGVQVSFTAACAVRSADSDTDKLAVFFSPSSADENRLTELIKEIRIKVIREVGVNPEYLIPVAQEEIPKTEIGKIQRLQLKRRFELGEFAWHLKRLDLLLGNVNTLPDWFYRRVWRRKQASTAPLKAGMGVVVLFLDQLGLGSRLSDALTSHSWMCVSIQAGDEFVQQEDGFQINPRDPEHYSRVLDLIAQQGRPVERVLHLWSYTEYTGEISSLDALRQAQDEGVYSVLFLTQALARANEGAQPVQLFVVSNHAQAVLPQSQVAYEKSTLIGLLKTTSLELAWLRCRHLDLETDRIEANVERVLFELGVPAGEAEVAYRHGQRLIPLFAPANLTQQPTRESAFERGGVYLVTGGLGGIGTQVARYLIQNYAACLILVGRTPLPEKSAWPAHLDQKTTLARRIRNYQAIEESGGEFIYAVANVCDRSALQQAIAQAEAKWGKPLAGILHLAGEGNLEVHWTEMDLHRVTVETKQWFEAMFESKVYGTWTLRQILKDRPHATFVAFSSVNALFGGGTFSAYSAANSFLDGCAFHLQQHAHSQTWCINWTMWDELGMSEGNPQYARDVARAMGYHVIAKEQGLSSLMAVLRRDPAHVIVGLDGSVQHVRRFIDGPNQAMQQLAVFYTVRPGAQSVRWPELRDRFDATVVSEFRQVSQMPLTIDGQIDRAALLSLKSKGAESNVTPSAPQTDAERKIAAVWQELLRVDKVSTQDNFFDLGGDSLLLVQFHSRLQTAFGRDLPVVEMFKYPTISALANYLSQMPDQPSLQESETRADARRAAIQQRRGARS